MRGTSIKALYKSTSTSLSFFGVFVDPTSGDVFNVAVVNCDNECDNKIVTVSKVTQKNLCIRISMEFLGRRDIGQGGSD